MNEFTNEQITILFSIFFIPFCMFCLEHYPILFFKYLMLLYMFKAFIEGYYYFILCCIVYSFLMHKNEIKEWINTNKRLE